MLFRSTGLAPPSRHTWHAQTPSGWSSPKSAPSLQGLARKREESRTTQSSSPAFASSSTIPSRQRSETRCVVALPTRPCHGLTSRPTQLRSYIVSHGGAPCKIPSLSSSQRRRFDEKDLTHFITDTLDFPERLVIQPEPTAVSDDADSVKIVSVSVVPCTRREERRGADEVLISRRGLRGRRIFRSWSREWFCRSWRSWS